MDAKKVWILSLPISSGQMPSTRPELDATPSVTIRLQAAVNGPRPAGGQSPALSPMTWV